MYLILLMIVEAIISVFAYQCATEIKQTCGAKKALAIVETLVAVFALMCGCVGIVAFCVEPFGAQNLEEILEALQ